MNNILTKPHVEVLNIDLAQKFYTWYDDGMGKDIIDDMDERIDYLVDKFRGFQGENAWEKIYLGLPLNTTPYCWDFTRKDLIISFTQGYFDTGHFYVEILDKHLLINVLNKLFGIDLKEYQHSFLNGGAWLNEKLYYLFKILKHIIEYNYDNFFIVV